jgi:phage gpG-like protein
LGVAFNSSALGRLAAGLEQISSAGWRRRLNERIAESVREQIAGEFAAGKDPYGRPWAPLTSRTGAPLRDTNRFRNSWTARAQERGFEVSSDFVGAAVHNFGAVIHAKTERGLVFQVESSFQVFSRGGKRPARPKVGKSWRRLMQVTIPKRQIIPDQVQGMGSRWGAAIQSEISAAISEAIAAGIRRRGGT